MSAISKNIVTQLSKKTGGTGSSTEYEVYDIGAQLQYVSSIINSNNHNLEEQIVIGTDADTTFTQEELASDEEVLVPFVKETWTTNFRIANSTTDYYRLVTVRKRDHKFNLSINGTLTIISSPHIFKERKRLYYITNNGTTDIETLVSVKTYSYTYTQDASLNPIVVITEDITTI